MLVAFLEDRCVRLLPIEKRGPLRKPGDAWHAAFADYLEQAGCPAVSGAQPYARPRLAEYVKWLVGNAISLAYEDRAAAINTGAAAALSTPAVATVEPVAIVSEEAAGLIRELAALLNVSSDERDALHTLQAVHRAIRHRVAPAIAQAEASPAAASDAAGAGARDAAPAAEVVGSSAPVKKKGGSLVARRAGGGGGDITLSPAFPLGFSTGDAVADRAASVLRMLYVADVRDLQDAVNDILVAVQEYTANPKTDSSLGQVGR